VDALGASRVPRVGRPRDEGADTAVIRHVVAFVALAGTWLLMSGIYDNPLLLGLGFFSVLAVVLMMRRLDREDGAALPYKMGLRPLLYVPWILWEITKSGLHVARVVLTPSLPLGRRLLRVKGSMKTDIAQVVYGNSITLTPGTLTLDIREGEFLVHALTDDAADGLLTGDMDRKVAALEGSE
jgi:multicomponent Na+:H+ antiporter subunit E